MQMEASFWCFMLVVWAISGVVCIVLVWHNFQGDIQLSRTSYTASLAHFPRQQIVGVVLGACKWFSLAGNCIFAANI
jgi:hypothetical protein